MNNAVYGPLAAFLASVTWTVGSSTYSYLARTNSSASINFTRALIALPFFVVFSLILSWFETETLLSGIQKVTLTNISWLSISNLASYAFGDVLFLTSTRYVGVPTALSIASIYPIFAACAAWFFENQPLSTTHILGLLFVVCGTVFILTVGRKTLVDKSFESVSSQKFAQGVLLAFLTSLSWALNSFSASKGGAGVSTADANIVRMTLAILLCPVVGFALDKKVHLMLPWSALRRFLPIFILESFIGSCFYIYGMTNSPVAIGAALTSLAPALSMPVAITMGWERFSKAKTFGIVTVVLGVILLVDG